MTTFEIWELKDKQGRFLYSNVRDNDNVYKFCTEQKTTKEAIEKVKEIFKTKYGIEDFQKEELSGTDYLFSVIINGFEQNFIMFEIT